MMPGRPPRNAPSDGLVAEVSASLPLFEDLPGDTIRHLSEAGFGRGFLTASLRARLRKAGFRDLGHLAESSPDAIAGVRKFGPVRVERVRAFIVDEIARCLPGGRALHTPEAAGARRLSRLQAVPVGRLPLDAAAVAALGLEGGTCADVAGRSRRELLGTGVVTSGEVDRVVATLARFLEAGRPFTPPTADGVEAPPDAAAVAAHRAALLAERDREWEDAAPPRDRRCRGKPHAT